VIAALRVVLLRLRKARENAPAVSLTG
jgi:hypothetical protein